MKKKIVKKTVWLLQDKSTSKFWEDPFHDHPLAFKSRSAARETSKLKDFAYKPVKATFQISLA